MKKYKKIKSFEDLIVYQEAHKLLKIIYHLINKFPPEEKYNLCDQMRRAALSVTSNIAEGFARRTANDKCRFYINAKSSLSEINSQTITARDLKIVPTGLIDKTVKQIISTDKLLTNTIKATREERFINKK